MVEEIRILGLLIRDRIKESGRTQELLSRHAHLIRSRLGFHEVSEAVCSRVGVIILQLSGDPEACKQLEKALSEIGGVEVQHMIFPLYPVS